MIIVHNTIKNQLYDTCLAYTINLVSFYLSSSSTFGCQTQSSADLNRNLSWFLQELPSVTFSQFIKRRIVHYKKSRPPMIKVKHFNFFLFCMKFPLLHSHIASGLLLFVRSLHTSLFFYSRFLTGVIIKYNRRHASSHDLLIKVLRARGMKLNLHKQNRRHNQVFICIKQVEISSI